MNRVLVIGSNGMLGQDMTVTLQSSFEVFTRSHPELDICDRMNVSRDILEINPDIVINCAAYTDVDGCETERDLAFAVNAEGPKNIALACRETSADLCHISSDFVFDGRKNAPYIETDNTGPLSVYAESKLAGEMNIQNILPGHVIIRTSWLFGKGGKNFVSTIIKLADKMDVINIVDDQTGCPTYTVDLSNAIKTLLLKRAQGIYHFSNSGECTWHGFAGKIIEVLGLKTKVNPITSQQLGRPALRPAYSVMDCTKFASETDLYPRAWEDALKEYINSMQGDLK